MITTQRESGRVLAAALGLLLALVCFGGVVYYLTGSDTVSVSGKGSSGVADDGLGVEGAPEAGDAAVTPATVPDDTGTSEEGPDVAGTSETTPSDSETVVASTSASSSDIRLHGRVSNTEGVPIGSVDQFCFFLS